jgi:methionyl-tRNA formyltransferase
LHRQGEPGVVGEDGVVGTASGAIEIVELQSAGGRAMLWRDFVRGRPQVIGQRFMPRH